jgi:hypothetical protein
LPIAALLPLTVACGSRTGLLASTEPAPSIDAGDDAPETSTASPDCPIAAGTAMTLASDRGTGEAIQVGATDVYWSDGQGLYAVPICGGSVTTIASSPDAPGHFLDVAGLAVDAANLYWDTLSLGPSGPTYALNRTPQAGGATVTLATITTGAGGAVVSDGTTVFFASGADCNINFSSCPAGEILSVPVGGGAVTTLVMQQGAPISALALDASTVYFATAGQSAFTGSIAKVAMTGGAVTTLAAGVGSPQQLLRRGSTLVWRADTDGAVVAMPVSGGAPTTLASGQLVAQVIAADATTVFIGTVTGIIETVPLGGGALSTLTTTSLHAPDALVADAMNLYWAGSDVVRYGLP